MTIPITRRHLATTVITISLSAFGWGGTDYVKTRDTAYAAKQQAEQLEKDVRETRQNMLRVLVMMNVQFTGDTQEIARLRAELQKLKEEKK